MDKELRAKLKKLAGLMNDKTELKIPIVPELIDCMECVVGHEEADFLLKVGDRRLSFDELRKLSDLPDDKYETLISNVQRKGFLWVSYASNRKDGDDKDYAQLFQILPGWVELILSDGAVDDDRIEFAEKFTNLLNILFKFNIQPVRGIVNAMFRGKQKGKEPAPISISAVSGIGEKRVIPINKNIKKSESIVMPGKDAVDLIKDLPEDYPISLMHCFCRIIRNWSNEPCQFELPEDSCIVIGDRAVKVAEFNIGKYISKEEAISIVEECEKKGAIHNIYHEGASTDNPKTSICNCCWDCCITYGSYNRGSLSPIYVKTDYMAKIKNEENCVSCGLCAKYCPTAAITLKGSKPEVEEQRCIGCGQCASKCQKDVVELQYGERKVFVPSLPKNKARIKYKKPIMSPYKPAAAADGK